MRHMTGELAESAEEQGLWPLNTLDHVQSSSDAPA